jgi:hypothetical protein
VPAISQCDCEDRITSSAQAMTGFFEILPKPANQCVAPTIAGGVVTVPAIRTGLLHEQHHSHSAHYERWQRPLRTSYNAMELRGFGYIDTPTETTSLFRSRIPFDFRQDHPFDWTTGSTSATRSMVATSRQTTI